MFQAKIPKPTQHRSTGTLHTSDRAAALKLLHQGFLHNTVAQNLKKCTGLETLTNSQDSKLPNQLYMSQYNPRTGEAKAGIPGQPKLDRETLSQKLNLNQHSGHFWVGCHEWSHVGLQ